MGYDIRRLNKTTTTEPPSGDTSTYQEKLVSGVNIKTVNGYTLLGSGNVTIDPQSTIDGGSF